MQSIDLKLLLKAGATRALVAGGTALAIVRAAAIVAWAYALASLIGALALSLMPDAVQGPQNLTFFLRLGVTAFSLKALATWLMGILFERAAVRAKSNLRQEALQNINSLGPNWLAKNSQSALTLRLTRGLDALDGYFADYLPTLFLTVVVTPIVVVAVALHDPLSAIIVVIVFPIIPIFMVLIGLATKVTQQKQWGVLLTMSRAYLDTVRGLGTLKLFGRQDRQVDRIKNISEQYRKSTMKVLRVTFLSGFVLDLAGTFSVALVAVTVGTRLVAGEFDLVPGLFVLLLVPEAFIPIRQVGQAFHASAEGRVAATEVFEIIEAAAPHTGTAAPATVSGATSSVTAVEACGLEIYYDDTRVVGPLNFAVQRGEMLALTGPSGSGKSSILATLLGVTSYSGSLKVAPNFAWSGQNPGLMRGTILDNVALADAGAGVEADPLLAQRALDFAAAGSLDLHQKLGVLGEGLSGGQKARVSLARAYYQLQRSGAKLLLLDEPTSALDLATEEEVVKNLLALKRSGCAVLVASHSDTVIAAADREVQLACRV